MESLEDRVLRRVRALYEKPTKSGDKWTAEKLMPFLGMSVPSGVRKLLNGHNRISLAHLEGFCVAFQTTPCELVSEPDAQMQPISPFEAAVLRIVRDMSELERRSLLTVLERPVYAAHPKKSRLGRAMLTVKEQELVDLFARVKRDGVREGVLKTLRGAAQDETTTDHPKARTTG